jgi:hypothetical protein
METTLKKSELEFESVTLQVPRKLWSCYVSARTLAELHLKKYIENYVIVQMISADLEAGCLIQLKDLIKKFDIEPVFEEYDCTIHV